mgnify:FL=1
MIYFMYTRGVMKHTVKKLAKNAICAVAVIPCVAFVGALWCVGTVACLFVEEK